MTNPQGEVTRSLKVRDCRLSHRRKDANARPLRDDSMKPRARQATANGAALQPVFRVVKITGVFWISLKHA